MTGLTRTAAGLLSGLVLSLYIMPLGAEPAPQPARPGLEAVPGKASAKQVAEFRARRGDVLKSYPIGGPQLSSVVKALVLADPGLVDDLIASARDGNALQRSAIGSGLGQAVRAIAAVDRALADEIARKIAGTGLADILAGYSAGQGDVQTLATTAASVGPSSSSGFVSGFGAAVPNNFFGASGRGARSSEPGSFSTPNFSSQSAITRYGGASVSCVVSVSPRRRC